MILVLTDQHDKHADCVCNKFDLRELRYFRLNLDVASLQQTSITFAGNTWKIRQHHEEIFSSEIVAVWARRPFVEVMLDEETDGIGFKIWRGEWNKTLLGLYKSLNKTKWLNPLAKSYQAENKYLQLDAAIEVGFLVPDFIVSNNKPDIVTFSEAHQSVVLKPQNQEFYKDPADGSFKGMYVNKLSKQDLDNFSHTGENPIFVQAYIEKQYEVRYTVVNGTHHVCRIESQKSKFANIDWRRYDIPNTPHYPMEPPQNIRKQVNSLMDILGLRFGALDFIVTPSNDWYFLEINAMGQWLWIEDLTGLNISGSIVDFF
jgi:glutathione synthase/RimK-type ligase-like ATP-grasp enzyme